MVRSEGSSSDDNEDGGTFELKVTWYFGVSSVKSGWGTDKLIDHVIVYPDCQFVGIECCLRD